MDISFSFTLRIVVCAIEMRACNAIRLCSTKAPPIASITRAWEPFGEAHRSSPQWGQRTSDGRSARVNFLSQNTHSIQIMSVLAPTFGQVVPDFSAATPVGQVVQRSLGSGHLVARVVLEFAFTHVANKGLQAYQPFGCTFRFQLGARNRTPQTHRTSERWSALPSRGLRIAGTLRPSRLCSLRISPCYGGYIHVVSSWSPLRAFLDGVTVEKYFHTVLSRRSAPSQIAQCHPGE